MAFKASSAPKRLSSSINVMISPKTCETFPLFISSIIKTYCLEFLFLKSSFLSVSIILFLSSWEYFFSDFILKSLLNLRLTEEEEMNRGFPEDYASGLAYALAYRPELRKVRSQVIQSYMALDMARAEYLPTLDAQARFYMDDPDARFSTSRDNWVAGVILNWEVFTGLSTRSKIDQARSALDEMLALDRKTTQAIQLDLKSAYLSLAEAKARIEVTRASVAQAEESLFLVKKEYEGGSATITRYMEAELALNRARIQARAAHYDKAKALASVGRGIGYWASYSSDVRQQHGD